MSGGCEFAWQSDGFGWVQPAAATITEIAADDTITVTSPTGPTTTIGVAYAPPYAHASRSTVLSTGNSPANPEVYLTFDDGAGGDITLVPGTYALLGSFFATADAANAQIWIQAQQNVFSSGWVDIGIPVTRVFGSTTGAGAETGIAELPPIMATIGVKFRWLLAKAAGPGGSTVSIANGYASLGRLT